MAEDARLRRIVSQGELTTAEFKSEYRPDTRDGKADLAKHAIAITNTCNRVGHIVLGAYEDGTPSGVDHTNFTEERLHRILNEYCEPYIDAILRHIEVAGSLVSVIELYRRTVDLPYRAAKRAGTGPILERGKIYFRHGRHSEEARFAEISSLIAQGDGARARQRRARPPADDYKYLSPDQKTAAMMRDWRTALRRGGLRLSRRRYYLMLWDERPTRRRRLSRDIIPAEIALDGNDYLLLSLVRPGRIRPNMLEPLLWLRHRWLASSPTGQRRLIVIVAHDAVGRPLPPGVPRDVIVEREPFGWYAGSPLGASPSGALDAHLLLENVRSKASMHQAVSEVLDWIRTQATLVNLLPDN